MGRLTGPGFAAGPFVPWLMVMVSCPNENTKPERAHASALRSFLILTRLCVSRRLHGDETNDDVLEFADLAQVVVHKLELVLSYEGDAALCRCCLALVVE